MRTRRACINYVCQCCSREEIRLCARPLLASSLSGCHLVSKWLALLVRKQRLRLTSFPSPAHLYRNFEDCVGCRLSGVLLGQYSADLLPNGYTIAHILTPLSRLCHTDVGFSVSFVHVVRIFNGAPKAEVRCWQEFRCHDVSFWQRPLAENQPNTRSPAAQNKRCNNMVQSRKHGII